MNVVPAGDESTVPRLYSGRCPEAGVGDAYHGVRTVVYEAEGIESHNDVELVMGRYRQPDTLAEICFQPGFEMRTDDPGVVVGYEVKL